MIGNIKRPNPLKPFDPSLYFDPTTNTCTEADFIKILEKGVYDSSLIGKFVTLSNTVDYNGGKWVIADVNHDSENTGQTNCYDLISVDAFHGITFGGALVGWRNSNPRTWLNNTFYDGFSSNFKSRMLNQKYKYFTTWYDDDKIIIPDHKEVNTDVSADGGIAYPIFTDNNSRRKHIPNNDNYAYWWLRTNNWNNNNAYTIIYDGSLNVYNITDYSWYLAPILRVQ